MRDVDIDEAIEFVDESLSKIDPEDVTAIAEEVSQSDVVQQLIHDLLDVHPDMFDSVLDENKKIISDFAVNDSDLFY